MTDAAEDGRIGVVFWSSVRAGHRGVRARRRKRPGTLGVAARPP